MKNIYAVVTATDYLGSGLQTSTSVHSAQLIKAKLLEGELQIPYENIKESYGAQSSKNRFVEDLRWLAAKLQQEPSIAITIYAGHGNNLHDITGDEVDGMDEYYQMVDGILLDDEFTSIFHNMHPESLLVAISDCCSSGSALDIVTTDKTPFKGNWISIGASTDIQDAMQSGDGGVLSVAISDNATGLSTKTFREIKTLISDYVKNSWVGELQNITIQVSSEKVWNMKFKDA